MRLDRLGDGGDDPIKIGSLFHRVGATTEKAQSPFVFI